MNTYAHTLKHARITEKASDMMSRNVYVFDVDQKATKRDIVRAVRLLYKVTPAKVAIVAVPSKTTRNPRTGQSGVKPGGKKAYVYLKGGDSISLS